MLDSCHLAAERLQQQKTAILERWEAEVRQAIPATRAINRASLWDALPTVLTGLVADLRASRAPGEAGRTSPASQHGEQRARLRGYAADQLVTEYQILRRIIFEVLEEPAPLPPGERNILLNGLDQAVQVAVAAFAAVVQQAETARRERAEEASTFSQRVLDTVRHPSLVLDRGLRVVFANRAFYRTFRMSGEQTHGRFIYSLGNGQWNLPELRARLESVIPRDAAFDDFAMEREFPGLGRRILYLNAQKLVAAGEHTDMILVAMEDVTERQALVEALQEREGEARQLAAQLAEADRRKDEFLAVLAHEFRTPLGAIGNAMYVLQNSQLTDERANRQIAAAQRQTQHMSRLIEDLLDVSRISRGVVDIRVAETDLRAVFHAACEACRPLILRSRHELMCSAPEQPLWVQADALRIEQVLTNLLNNAAKYTVEGGHIHATVAADGDWAAVKVTDTGIGIDAAVLPRIFEMYVQVHDSPRSESGLGIGLAVVKRLVDLHGGTISARSEGVGKGSEFEVRLPLSRV